MIFLDNDPVGVKYRLKNDLKMIIGARKLVELEDVVACAEINEVRLKYYTF